MNRIVLPCFFLIFCLPSTSEAQDTLHAFLWTANSGMQDLGTLPGWQGSTGGGINDFGQVVGESSMDDGSTTCSGWSEKTGMRRAPGFSTRECGAVGINNAGQVVGENLMSDQLLHAFLWTHSKGTQYLGDLGSGSSIAYAINKSGIIVGQSANSIDIIRPFVWSQSGGMQDLIDITENCPDCQGIATAINDNGVIVGQLAANSKGYATAFMWRNGRVRFLGMIGGQQGRRGSFAMGINKSGEIVGTSTVADGSLHPFLWTNAQGMQDLGLLPNATECFANGINDSTQIVGDCSMVDSTRRAFIWSASSGMQDIGTLGGTSAIALAINDAGQVTGQAATP